VLDIDFDLQIGNRTADTPSLRNGIPTAGYSSQCADK
jgi:hypothetical protein